MQIAKLQQVKVRVYNEKKNKYKTIFALFIAANEIITYRLVVLVIKTN